MDDRNYIEWIAEQIRLQTKVSSSNENLDSLFDGYADLALTKGTLVTNEDVHTAWLAWATEYEPESQWIVPYDELSDDVKDEDTQFTEAIRTVSAAITMHSLDAPEKVVY